MIVIFCFFGFEKCSFVPDGVWCSHTWENSPTREKGSPVTSTAPPIASGSAVVPVDQALLIQSPSASCSQDSASVTPTTSLSGRNPSYLFCNDLKLFKISLRSFLSYLLFPKYTYKRLKIVHEIIISSFINFLPVCILIFII